MDQKILESMFEQSQKHNANNDSGKMQFTPDEADRFKKAFADPKFREMFSEYMDEIQDPKYRQETEAYISQLEGEERVPEGKELIRPIAGFVAKTHKIQETATKEKVFLNIVQSEKISAPSKTSTSKGDHWSVPYSLGPPHMEKDKKGENSTCFDCCFHPQALALGERNPEFKKLLVSTAMEGVEEYCKRAQQKVQLERNFHIVKGISYKEGMIPSMMIATSSKENWKGGSSSTNNNPSSNSPQKASSTNNNVSSGAKRVSDPPASHSDDEKGGSPAKASESTKLPTKSKTGTVIKKGFLVSPSNTKKASLYGDKIQTVRPKQDKAAEGEDALQTISSSVTASNPSIDSRDKGEASPELSANLAKSLQLDSSDPTPKAEPAIVSEQEMKAVSTKRKPTVEKKVEVTPTPAVSTRESREESSSSSSSFPMTPKVIVKHRDEITLGDFDGVKSDAAVKSNRPKELVYEIELPLVSAPSKINLDVSEKRLSLTYLEKYKLEMKLPYLIYDKKGKAAYDKSKKVLKITLPVVQESLSEVAKSDAASIGNRSHKPAEEIAAKERSPQNDAAEEKEEEEQATSSADTETISKKTKKKETEKTHNRWVEKSSTADEGGEEEQEKKKFYEEIKQKAEQAKLEAMRAPPAVRTTATLPSPPPAATTTASTSTAVPEAELEGGGGEFFIASKVFAGRKSGYCFRNGDEGVGYYRDIAAVAGAGRSSLSSKKESEETANLPPSPAAAAVKVIDYLLPPLEVRQTKGAVSIILQVPGIVKSTVQVEAISAYVVRLAFQAISTTTTSTTSTESVDPVPYGVEFTLAEKDCLEGIDMNKITYDVAGKNMVLIFLKKTEQLFGGSDSNSNDNSGEEEEGEEKISWMQWKAYSKEIIVEETESVARKKTKKETEVVSPSSSSANRPMTRSTSKTTPTSSNPAPLKTLASDAFKSTVSALQFSTDFISELD